MARSNSKQTIIYGCMYLCVVSELFGDKHLDMISEVPSFSLIYEGQPLYCSPIKLIYTKTHKNKVTYHCVSKNPGTPKIKQKISQEEKRGRSETDRLRADLEKKQEEDISYTVQINHSDATRPRVVAIVARQQLENRHYGKILTWLLPARFYVSIRPQLTTTGTDKQLKYRNGGTRGGFYYYYAFDSDLELMLQYEANIRDGDGKSFIDFSDISNSSRRLSYLSLSYEKNTILYGKYWSAYYDIASFTDYFMAFGKQGTGAFNHGGDGSESGTGRTDHTAQYHLDKGNLQITMQYQFAHAGPDDFDAGYHYSTAGSFVYNTQGGLIFGAAAAYAKFDSITPAMQALGITGEDISAIAGLRYEKEQYGVGLDISYSRNHTGDDQGDYFDAVGGELYLHYDLDKNIRFAGGGNWMIPRDDHYKGHYSIRKGILSLQYTFGKATFDDLVYLELAFPKGHLADGTPLKTSIAIGFRYLFDLH